MVMATSANSCKQYASISATNVSILNLIFEEHPMTDTTLPAGILNNTQNEELICNATTFDPSIKLSEACIHDSAANRHMFHTKSIFSKYDEIDPVLVKGFGRELTTSAISKGTMIMQAWSKGGSPFTFKLLYCLHIPTACYNLILQSQLDHNGICAQVGNK
jgi:hypothetical protein